MNGGTVLVTGGSGYVGSHACKALAARGLLPVTYDDLERGHAGAVRWGPLVEGRIQDTARLDAAFAQHRPAAVLHFAAYAYVGESVEDPARYYRNNVAGTLELLEAMRRHGVGRLVFSSTCAVYGVVDGTIDEATPKAPINPYGASKLMVERCIEDYARAFGLNAVSLRYFNAAGCDPDGEIGENHDPEPHLIPRIVAAALGRLDRLVINGDDYATPDGTCIRDYVHVSDLAAAHVLALDRVDARPGASVFNLGTGHGHSVRELVAAVEAATGRRVPLAIGPSRPGDPDRLVASAGRARAELGWQPRHSDLDTIIRTAVRWATRNGA